MSDENENNEGMPEWIKSVTNLFGNVSDCFNNSQDVGSKVKCMLPIGYGTLKVIVKNSFNDKPISGTDVELVSHGKQSTDAKGEAVFYFLPPGNHSVKALLFPMPNILTEATDSLSVASKDVQIKANETTDVEFKIERIRWPLQSNHIRKGQNSNTYGKDVRIKKILKDGTIVTKPHWGWDLEAAIGTPIYAISDGRIEVKEEVPLNSKKTYYYDGSTINAFGHRILMSFNFKGTTYYAYYAHLSQIDANLKVGDDVEFGQKLGKTGQTGNAWGQDASDDHLHFEIHTTSGELAAGETGRKSPLIIYGLPPLSTWEPKVFGVGGGGW